MDVPKKSGRPRSFSIEDALDRASELFLERGYEGCTLGMLTETMGVHKPSLYSAFGSKEQLFVAVLRRYQDAYRQRFDQIVELGLEPKETIHEMLRLVANSECSNTGCLLVNSTALVNSHHDELAAEIRAIHELNLSLVRDYLIFATEEGTFSGDVDATARFYGAVMHGLAVSHRTTEDLEAQRQIISFALNAWPEAE